MKRIFLTGATGFVGSYIARHLLQANYEVVAIHRSQSKFSLVSDIYDRIEWIECDLKELDLIEDRLQDIDAVIHSGALVSFSPEDNDELMAVNVAATEELVNICLEHKVKRLVHLSSIAALGRYKGNHLIDEKAEWSDSPQNTPYAASKNLGERAVWRGAAEGLDTIILNPSLIIGPGDYINGTSAIIPKLLKGIPFYPIGSTGFVDVRDVARFAVASLTTEMSGERFIISAENNTYKAYLSLISKELAIKAPGIPLNKFLGALAWRGDYLRNKIFGNGRLFTKEMIHASSTDAKFSNKKSFMLSSKDYITLSHSIKNLVEQYKLTLNKLR